MMKMLLRDMTFAELAAMLAEHEGSSSAPHLIDPEARKRARRNAKQNGVWQHIGQAFDPTQDIPVFKRSDYRHLRRTGNRTHHQGLENARSAELELAALALWLDHPKADLDYLQDLLWAYCDDWTWVMAAHEDCTNDLGSTHRGRRLAEIAAALADQIEPEVADRVHGEIDRRIFREVADPRNTEFWHTARMNWNHVCNGNIIRAALLEMKNIRELAKFIHPLINNMTYAIDGFTDDGGCEEGPGYWGYGFGNFVEVAYALHCRTEGELNIMADEKIERICRFPFAAHIDGAYRASFADTGEGAMSPLVALQINRFYDIPGLFELCARRVKLGPKKTKIPEPRLLHKFTGGALKGAGPLVVREMHSLALYRGEKATGRPDLRDYFLPNLGTVKMRGLPGPKQLTVAALAGNNGVPHNHNDIGSFLVYQNGRMVLTDPGGPQYTKKTFSSQRYEILFCRSRGHSVPIINGREQKAGGQYRGELSVEGLNEPGVKLASIDMTRAYPRGTVRSLVRTLALDYAGNVLTIEDAYRFGKKPESLEEAFVTFEKAAVVKRGRAVVIGPARGGMELTAGQAGRFRVETLRPEPEDAKPGTPELQRITFEPAKLAEVVSLRFALRPRA